LCGWELFLADIFHEVDEEVRRERLQKLWERYSIHIIVLAVLVVAAVGGWRGYQWWEHKQAAAAGAKFEAALALSAEGKHTEAEQAFAAIAAKAPAGYATLARYRAAAELARAKPDAAVKAYDALAADASLSQTLRDLASLRAAILLVDKAPLADLQKRLDPLTGAGRTFHASARELLALSAWHHGDIKAAKLYLGELETDASTPPGTRARAQVLSALIAARGGKS
jgi:hypothetical protein